MRVEKAGVGRRRERSEKEKGWFEVRRLDFRVVSCWWRRCVWRWALVRERVREEQEGQSFFLWVC